MAMLKFLLLTFLLWPALARADDFALWLETIKHEAAAQGLQPSTLAALDAVEFKERVIELDQQQPESRLDFPAYLEKTVTDARIEKGRALLNQHRALLNRVAATYRVQPRFIIALWGKETDYGRFTGGFNVLDALATLAYEGRRADYFKGELFNALRIIESNQVTAENMRGSWAGAMGQCQFMPTSYFRYAVDGDGDGRADIWNNLADVFASIANYLATEGWDDQQTWGRAVSISTTLAESETGLKTIRPLQAWAEMGVKSANGAPLPSRVLDASLVRPDGVGQGNGYLAYNNYRVLMHWNRSVYFATAVGLLADAIGD